MEQDTEQKNMQNPPEKQTRKNTILLGCFGLLGFLILGAGAIVLLYFFITTPEERAQYKENSKKQSNSVITSPYWEKDNSGSIPFLKAERYDDVESKGQVIRVSAGRDRDYQLMFTMPAREVREGFSREFKENEPPGNGFFFALSDGKNQWRVFDNFDSPITLTVKTIQREKEKITFNLSGIIRHAVQNPHSKSSFFDPVPGGESMKLNLDITVWGADYATLVQKNGDWQNLKPGRVYRLEKETVLVPSLNVRDGIEAIKQMKKIAPGALIGIQRSQVVDGKQWYHVSVFASDSKQFDQPIATGWVNPVALLTQKLKLMN